MNALKNLNQAFQASAARTRRGNRAPVSIIVAKDGDALYGEIVT
jgi:hypothetical protein